MTSDKTKNTSVTPISEPRPNLEEAIRRRAYELYDQRGREDGHDVDDWVRAEGEVNHSAAKTMMAA